MAQSEQNSVQTLEDLVEQMWNMQQQFCKMEEFVENKVMQPPLADVLFQKKSNTALYAETAMDIYRFWDVLHEDPPIISWWFRQETISDWLCGDITTHDSELVVTAWIEFVVDNLWL